MGEIPREKIDEVLAAADITEVAADYVGRLKKSGSRYMALCPFHDEDTPSFSLSPEKNLFYCFGCLEEHEPVWTERGLIPISQMQIGDRVLGLDGRLETVTDKVVKTGRVLALNLDVLKRDALLLTPDHTCVAVRKQEALHAVPMLHRSASRGVRFRSDRQRYRKTRACEIREVEAEDVRAGDYFLFPVVSEAKRLDAPLSAPGPVPVANRAAAGAPRAAAGAPVPAGAMPLRAKGPEPTTFAGLPVNEATARLYGLWLAEGSCYRGGVRWSFHKDETHYANFIAQTLDQHFGLSASLHARPGRGQLEVTCSNTHLSSLLPHWFGSGAEGKQLPFQVLRWSQPVQRALLQGYLEGDGKNIARRQWRATSISRRLIQGLFALAIQAGRSVSMSKDKRKTTAGNTVWALGIRQRESGDGFFHTLDGQAYYWMRVGGACLLPEERTVVDLTVTGSHTFTTKLGAVHNCQKGGSVFTLVQEMEGVAFPQAVRQLADRFGVDLPQDAGGEAQSGRREPLYHALRFAARFFHRQLTQTDGGAKALAYLEERGLEPQTVTRFGLGYAPGRWDALLKAAEDEPIDAEVLEAAGLAIARDSGDGHYDRYRGRVIFPIFSRVGRVLGFAGRVFEGAEGPAVGGDFDPPKYINSPETEVYHKQRVLYGLHQAKGAIRKDEEALLVEGYTDVIALHQAGVEHAVATCGTALTEQQVHLLSRYAERVLLLYDADEAGARAATRGMDRVLEAGLAAYAVRLPEGDDPDDYIRKEGAEAFRRLLRKRRQGVAAFHRAQAERDGAFSTPEDQTRTMRAVAASLARIPDDIARENQLRAASDALGMYERHLRDAVEAARRGRRKQQRRRAPRPAPPAGEDAPPGEETPEEQAEEAPPAPLPQERNLLRLLLEHGRPMVEMILGHMALTEFTDGPAREMAGRFLEMYEAGDVRPQRVTEGDFGPELQRLAASVQTDAYEPSENWQRRKNIAVPRLNEDARKAAALSMRHLKLIRVKEAIADAQAAQYRTTSEEEEREAQKRMMRLQELRRQVEHGAFFDWNDQE